MASIDDFDPDQGASDQKSVQMTAVEAERDLDAELFERLGEQVTTQDFSFRRPLPFQLCVGHGAPEAANDPRNLLCSLSTNLQRRPRLGYI
jgi:hypothetical protein